MTTHIGAQDHIYFPTPTGEAVGQMRRLLDSRPVSHVSLDYGNHFLKQVAASGHHEMMPSAQRIERP
jgi:hypothetical protein